MSRLPQTVSEWGLYTSDVSAGVAAELSQNLRRAEKDLIQHLQNNCTSCGEIEDVGAFIEAVYKCFERHLISSMKRHTDVGAADPTPRQVALDYLFHIAADHCDDTLCAIGAFDPIEA